MVGYALDYVWFYYVLLVLLVALAVWLFFLSLVAFEGFFSKAPNVKRSTMSQRSVPMNFSSDSTPNKSSDYEFMPCL